MPPDRHWKPRPLHGHAPTRLRPWLTDASSLTARIAARCGSLRVQVLRTGRALPAEDERRLVGLARKRLAWAREVLLVADGRAVVFAHTVLAPLDLRGPWRMAAGMGGRPLGAALFAQPRIVRGPLHCQRITAAHPLHRRAEKALGRPLPVLWARRSRFLHGGKPLLVTEVFLPDIERLG
jgi:chorismate--pyruvate lyase